jgi:hypothetical protein
LHFASNSKRPEEDKEYDLLLKLRMIFDTFNEAYAECYNPLEYLVLDKVIVKFKERVIFRQYIPKKRKRYGITIYKLL